MKHTRHGYWLEEAGTVEPPPPLSGDREADVVVVGGGYTGLWAAWHMQAAGARGAGRPARGRDRLRARAERPQRRLLQRDVVLAAEHAARAGGTRRRCRGPRGRAARSSGIGEFCEERGGRRLVPAGAATSRSRPRRPTTGPGTRRWPPAASWGCRRRCRPLAPERGRRALRLARLPRRRLLPELGDRAAGAAGAGAARAAAGARGRGLRVARRCASLRDAAGRGRGAHRRAARSAPAPRCSRSAAPPRAGAGRCATGSPSPPPTSSSPSRCPTCSRRSAGPAASASPTAAP